MGDSLEPQAGEILLYRTTEGSVKVEVFFQDETFWLNQRRMAELFGVESHTITYHLKEIYKSGELTEAATTRKIRVVQNEGSRDVSREVDFYNKRDFEKFVEETKKLPQPQGEKDKDIS